MQEPPNPPAASFQTPWRHRSNDLFRILSVVLVCGALPFPGHPSALAEEVIYFVLTDRFEDGDPGNNTGGQDPGLGRNQHGFDPESPFHYHGGDFQGLTQRLDYLGGLGVTAIWVTPPFTNKTVQSGVAGYHGYWITDFLNIDPHLGGLPAFRNFVREARQRGIKVYVDIVANHTADVISFAENRYGYVSQTEFPYLDTRGESFRVGEVAYGPLSEAVFPELDPFNSFPYTPVLSVAEAQLKNPDWLNDVTNYHNRGNSTFSGESSLLGDFFGLDDLFTEKPEVVEGFIDIFRYWILEEGVSGFRIDTVKHVNLEFWQRFAPAMRAAAAEAGLEDFIMFGEVFDSNPDLLSEFATTAELGTVLDFGFAAIARAYVSQEASAEHFHNLFLYDDLYRNSHGDASRLPLFLGNHDMGRWGHFLLADNPGASAEQLTRLHILGHALMFFLRGQPVIYYGDEQGFTGGGGSDTRAREDMLPSKVAEHQSFPLIGTEARTSADNFDQAHPLYQAIAGMAAVYREHPVFQKGGQMPLITENPAILGISREDPEDFREYLIFFNNARSNAQVVSVAPQTGRAGDAYHLVHGEGPEILQVRSGDKVSLSLQPLSYAVYRAASLPSSSGTPLASFASLKDHQALTLRSWEGSGHTFPGRVEIALEQPGEGPHDARFWLQRADRPGEWQFLGMDNDAPYRIFLRPPPDLPPFTLFNIRADVRNAAGASASASVDHLYFSPGLGAGNFVAHLNLPETGDWGRHDEWILEASGPATGDILRTAPFSAETVFGAFAWIPMPNPAGSVVINIRRASGSGPEHNVFPSSFTLRPLETPQIWVRADQPRIYSSPREITGDTVSHSTGSGRANERLAIIHYHRPDGDYGDFSSPMASDFWGLHVWTGAQNPTSWSLPLKPVGQTAFGVSFEIPLQNGATHLSYILHRGDLKDPGPDQTLNFAEDGREVWQAAEADPSDPFIVHTGNRRPDTVNYPDYRHPPPAPSLLADPEPRLQWSIPYGEILMLQKSNDGTNWQNHWPQGRPGTRQTESVILASPVENPQFFRLVRE